MTKAIWETAFSGPVPVCVVSKREERGIVKVTCKVAKDTQDYKRGETIETFIGQLWKKVEPTQFGCWRYQGRPKL